MDDGFGEERVPIGRRLLRALSRSRFFTVSVLLHSMVVLALSSTVLFRVMDEEVDFFGEPGGFLTGEPGPAGPPPPPPPPAQAAPNAPNASGAPSVATRASLSALTTAGPSVTGFAIPSFTAMVPTGVAQQISAPVAASAVAGRQLTVEAARQIQAFTGGWARGGGTGTTTSALKRRRFEFTAYLAKYAMGDWDSTVDLRDGKIWRGSLPNLLFLMRKWSSDRVNAQPDPVPLELGSGEIFEVKPPFIIFTGRRDFKLTDAEVTNLRKYLLSGGAIWGDSTLPGRRSRFDIAFRREMRRVLPDKDKDFEPLPPDHEVFTKNYFPEIRSVPQGLNFYQEPIEVLRIFGQVAVIYTANDYCDMWQVGLTEDGQIDRRLDENRQHVAINWPMLDNREIYFRNLVEERLIDTYKFGINLVIHLLVRWEDPLRRVPQLGARPAGG